MKQDNFLVHYLAGTASLNERTVEAPASLEHLMWDGIDRRLHGAMVTMECMRKVLDDPKPEDVTLFLTVMSELTGQELSCEHLSHRMRMQPRTVLQLLGAAENAGIWRHLKCFGRTDELVNDKSKGYVADVGLACQMFGIDDPAIMSEHHSWGALFETFIVNLLVQRLPKNVSVFYWRTAHGSAEVDMVLQYGKTLYPIEIKSAAHVSLSNARKIEIFTRFYEADYQVAPGLVVYTGERYYAMKDGIIAVPWVML